MNLRRRHLLQAGASLLLAQRALCEPVDSAGVARRHLSMRNLHTDEILDLDYSSGGVCLPQAMTRIVWMLRDFRTGEQHAIDPALLDSLSDLATALQVDPAFEVISGYRSPQTNELLRSQSSGVSLHSLHMDGRAIDVRLAGIGCSELAASALALGRGGVGYYRRADFVHLDSGLPRCWQG